MVDVIFKEFQEGYSSFINFGEAGTLCIRGDMEKSRKILVGEMAEK